MRCMDRRASRIRTGVGAGLLAAMIWFLQGCASVTTGGMQVVSVKTVSPTTEEVEANCELRNDKGQWNMISPGAASVRQSYQALSVSCRSDTHGPGSTSVSSSTKGMAYGNILAGGLIGATIDIASGAAYDYPSLITVLMGPPKPSGGAAGASPAAKADFQIRPGMQLTYATTDQFTRVSRSSTVTVATPGATMKGHQLGDASVLEPPQGWVAGPLALGSVWEATYDAADDLPRSQMMLKGQVLRRERLALPAGVFTTWVVEFRGTALRSGGAATTPHKVIMTVWVDAATSQLVQFESNITGSGGSQPGRISKERTELVRVEPAAAPS